MFFKIHFFLASHKLSSAHQWKIKADSTLRSSQAVPHPSTDRALSRLTSEVERDPVHSTWYGRQQQHVLERSLCAEATLDNH